jgi:hypothetical protein
MCGGYMLNKIIGLAFVIATLSLIGCSSEQYSLNGREHFIKRDTTKLMTQQDVINLSKSGVSDSLIISMLDATDTWFQLKPQNVIELKNAGVSENVIKAMMEQPSQPTNSTSVERYYVYPPYYWYDGFYPRWYYPSINIRLGPRSFHSGYFHRGRFH